MLKFNCPSCGQASRAPDELAGRKGRCKHCGAVFAIPTALEAFAGSTPEPEPAPASDAAPRPAPGSAGGPAPDWAPSPAALSGPDPAAFAAHLPAMRRGVPMRGWLAIGMLAAMMAVLFLMPDFGDTVQSRVAITLLAAASFAFLSGLFLMAFGPQKAPPKVVLTCFGVTFVSAIFVCLIVGWVALFILTSMGGVLALRFGLLLTRFRARGKAFIIMVIILFIAFCLTVARYSNNFWLSLMGNILGTGLLEETVKLLPVYYFIVKGRIFTRRSALLCGAFSGLGFGLIESIWYTYQMYIPMHLPASIFLLRFFALAASHALWTSIAAAALLALRMRGVQTERPWALLLLAIAASAVVHGFHNAFATTQIHGAGLVLAGGVIAALALLMWQGWRENPAIDSADAAAPVAGVFGRYLLPLGLATGLFCVASVAVSAYTGEVVLPSSGTGTYAIEFPADWQVRHDDEDFDVVALAPGEGADGQAPGHLCLTVKDLGETVDQDDFIAAFRRGIRTGGGDFSEVDYREAKLAGRQAHRMIYDARIDGVPRRMLVYALLDGTWMYTFYCYGPQQGFPEWEAQFEGILKTFEIK